MPGSWPSDPPIRPPILFSYSTSLPNNSPKHRQQRAHTSCGALAPELWNSYMVLRLVLCAVTAFPSILKLGWEVRRRDRCPQLGEYRTREADARRRVCAELRCANSIKHVAREGVGSKKVLSFGFWRQITSHFPRTVPLVGTRACFEISLHTSHAPYPGWHREHAFKYRLSRHVLVHS